MPFLPGGSPVYGTVSYRNSTRSRLLYETVSYSN